MQQPPPSSPLISVAELVDALAGPHPPVLLDVRWALSGAPGVDAYRAGHIAGACFVDLDRELAAPPGTRGRHPLPDAAAFEVAMRRCGVDGARGVVVYDAGGGLSGARAWWLLRYFGHPDVRVLDGGVAAWEAAGQPLTRDAPAPAAGDFSARPGGMPMLGLDDVLAFARAGALLDARAPERYRGESEPIDPVAGHIPGARSAPTTANLDATGRMRSAAELRERFATVGAVGDVPVATYCGSGVTAAHQVLALEVAGMRAALYPGSWSEWVADPTRPVATGPDPG